MSVQKIETVLEFPEGDFLIYDESLYFMQAGSDKAYLGWGPENELKGKIHRELATRSEQFKKYDVTYEIEDGALIAARLITPFNKSAGKLASPEKVQDLNQKLQSGALELKGKYNPPSISCAATLPTGETLLVVQGLKEEAWDASLFVGQPGNLQELTLTNGLQGGNRSIWTVAENGNKLEYDYRGNGWGREKPFYGDQIMTYIDVSDYEDLAEFGLNIDLPEPHLDPFCPELAQP